MKASHIVSFIVGGGLGSLLTWYFVKDYYATRSQEEIDSVIERWSEDSERIKRQHKDLEKEKKKVDREEKAKEVKNYAGMVNQYGYSEISTAKTNRWKDSNHDPRVPYVISPMDFEDDAYANYESVEFTYYADGVLANARDEVITQQESYESIGPDIFRSIRDHFGEYEEDPDIVYVRNESNFIHYIITRDNRTYSSVVGELIE